jgi:hypothetical protein
VRESALEIHAALTVVCVPASHGIRHGKLAAGLAAMVDRGVKAAVCRTAHRPQGSNSVAFHLALLDPWR